MGYDYSPEGPMSIACVLQPDQSGPLAKRFAHLASGYFDQLEDARQPGARIPLENLFRILEMLRYEAFSDEPSGGVVSFELAEIPPDIQQREPWHTEIKQALGEALTAGFGETPREQAIGQTQSVLRWLASGEGTPPNATIAATREFLRRFEELLT